VQWRRAVAPAAGQDPSKFDAALSMGCSQCPVNPPLRPIFFDFASKHSDTLRLNGVEPMLLMTWACQDKPEMTRGLGRRPHRGQAPEPCARRARGPRLRAFDRGAPAAGAPASEWSRRVAARVGIRPAGRPDLHCDPNDTRGDLR
jgi:hypothetical protein